MIVTPSHHPLKAHAFVSTVIAAVLAASVGHAAPQPGDADFPKPAPSARHDELVAKVRSGTYNLALIGDSITHRLWDLLHPGGSNLANPGQTSGGEAWIRAVEPTLARLMGDKALVDGPPVENPDPTSP